MMHRRRVFQVTDKYDTPASLAAVLAGRTWTLCSGFKVAHLLFLNDSTGEDGAQEYAVFDTLTGLQIESLTVGWMTGDELEKTILNLLKPDSGCRDMTSPVPSLAHPVGDFCHACR